MLHPELPGTIGGFLSYDPMRQDDETGRTEIIKSPVVEWPSGPQPVPVSKWLRFDPADRSLHLSSGFSCRWRHMRIRSWDAGVVTEYRYGTEGPWLPCTLDLETAVLSPPEPVIRAGLESGHRLLTEELCHSHPMECYAATFPREVRAIAGRFSLVQFRILRALAADARVGDIIGSNPALVFLAAVHFQETEGSPVHRLGFRSLLLDKRRAIAAFATGYDEERIVNLLGKLRFVVWDARALARIRELLGSEQRMRLLSHLDVIPGAVLRWVDNRQIAHPELLIALFHRLIGSAEESTPDALDTVVNTVGQLFLDLQGLVRDATVFVRQIGECRTLGDLQRLHDRHDQFRRAQDRQSRIESERQQYGTLDFPPPPFAGTLDIVPLRTVEELIDEGDAQHHCIGSYVSNVMLGDSYVYRVMKPERATLQLRRDGKQWIINQLRLACNAWVSEATMKKVDAWCHLRCAQGVMAPPGYRCA